MADAPPPSPNFANEAISIPPDLPILMQQIKNLLMHQKRRRLRVRVHFSTPPSAYAPDFNEPLLEPDPVNELEICQAEDAEENEKALMLEHSFKKLEIGKKKSRAGKKATKRKFLNVEKCLKKYSLRS